MIIGKPPFETTNVKSTYDKIRKNSYHFPSHVSISKEAKELIQWILHSDPTKRPNLEEIKNHSFLVLPSPKTLHPSLLACIPTKSFINKYTITASINYQSCKNLNVEKENMCSKIPHTAKEPKREGIELTENFMNTLRSPTKTDHEEEKFEKPIGEYKVPIHAKKWIDYTTKYGLGYVLSDGSIGVFFNDATKII